jgi:transketolase
MELRSTRDAYGDILVRLGEINQNVVVLDADLSTSTQTNKFAKKYPKRFFNVGCAEQNLIDTAAGFALAGKIPFASTYAMFSLRAWELMRNTVAHDNLNVKIAVSHSGLTNSSDGSSHQALEDLAIMRVLPNMRVIVPADAIEAEQSILTEPSRQGPAYIRLNRTKTPVIYDQSYEFSPGKAVQLVEGDDITLVATGTMVSEAMKASEALKHEGIDAGVLNIHTIKPLDNAAIIQAAKRSGAVVSIEEHSIHGGLGSAIAEVLIENYPVPMKIIGVQDRFGESGEYEELLQILGLNAENIVKQARKLMSVKT